MTPQTPHSPRYTTFSQLTGLTRVRQPTGPPRDAAPVAAAPTTAVTCTNTSDRGKRGNRGDIPPTISVRQRSDTPTVLEAKPVTRAQRRQQAEQRRRARRARVTDAARRHAEQMVCPDCTAETTITTADGVALVDVAHDETCPTLRRARAGGR